VDIGTAANGSNSEPKTALPIRDVRLICKRGGFRAALFVVATIIGTLGNLIWDHGIYRPREAVMKAKPDFKAGDRVVRIGDGQKRGLVSRVYQSGGLWWLAFEGEPYWRYSPNRFKRLA
jgi:hypothetical protein